jgi:UDP-3-O-[3-hydroxymyristoyl] N-acetylglucosamine deacetylase/3-hydroxyacyl-[acyl-carrier-protein] dehydratase
LRGTTIKENGVEVQTIEHVLAALVGLQIDNCLIELDAVEPPIMDGSALNFVRALKTAGIVAIPGSKQRIYCLNAPLLFSDQKKEKNIVGWPGSGLRVAYNLEYAHSWVTPQRVDIEVTPEIFEKEIAPCRTFCFEQEIEWLKSQGLAKGGNLQNAIVIGENGPLNPPLRAEDELARHKILDFLGDLALLGMRVKGRFVGTRSGHEMNCRLVKGLLQNHEQEKQQERGRHKLIIEASEIEKLLPHRYPMLLVDRVIDLELGKRAVGIKNLTMNEHFFQGHFPGYPIMPGVLIVEAMAQCGGVLVLKSLPEAAGKIVLFMGIDKVKFRKPVYPGDQLRLELEVDKIRSKVAKMRGQAFVGQDLVCEAELMSTLVDR